MTVGSLFTGIGGLDLGLEWAGMTIRWQVEVEEWCRERLARHWPAVRRRGDIRLVDPGDLAPVDLVCGGFPCQDISAAGKGAGITGRRSGFWKEMLRLVVAIRPCWVLVENVPALRTRGAAIVLGDLEAAGYSVFDPMVVGARHVGAPHRRDRVWIVAQLANTDDDRPQSERTTPCEGGASGHESHGRRERGRWPSRPGEAQHEWEAPRVLESGVGRATYGTARRLAVSALGDSVVPQVAELLGRAILALAAAPPHHHDRCRGAEVSAATEEDRR